MCGDSFKALAKYKAKCDEKFVCLIYEINNGHMNGKPSYVFKSSTGMAKLALAVDRGYENVMND